MVHVSEYAIRKNSAGESFCVLVVTGNLEPVKSKKTNKFYLTVRKASIPATFPENVAKSMIGQTLPGTINKVPCEPYTFITDAGEEVELDFSYEYSAESNNVVETVMG